jgi:pimeloyl-ACP methyl ester carboxylesterase
VGLECEVPETGDFKRSAVGERSVIMVRGESGENGGDIHVVENRCAHRGDVEAALAGDVPEGKVRAFLAANVVSGPDGLAWGVNLDAFARHLDDILGFPNVPQGRTFTGPSLFLAGGRSPYVRPEHHAAILRLFPAARIETIPAAGHWLHADAPEEFLAAVRPFLEG